MIMSSQTNDCSLRLFILKHYRGQVVYHSLYYKKRNQKMVPFFISSTYLSSFFPDIRSSTSG